MRQSKLCAICDIPISGCPAFHPDGLDAEGRHRWAHLSCASKLKRQRADRRERLADCGEEMLAALKSMLCNFEARAFREGLGPEDIAVMAQAETVLMKVEGGGP